MPLGFGVEIVPLTVRPPPTRCWLFAGSPRLGSGPLDGTRRADADPGVDTIDGRGGGAIKFPLLSLALGAAGLGGGIMDEARCGLFDAGNEDGTLSDSVFVSFDFSVTNASSSINVGTALSDCVMFALGVVSASKSDLESTVTSGPFKNPFP